MNSDVLLEVVNPDVLAYEIIESKELKEREVYIKGPFAEADVLNGNKRIYPIPVLESAVNEFVEQKVKQGRAVGELDHPPTTSINLERVSHKIIEMWQDKNVFFGKAKIMDTPMGKIAKELIAEGVKLGVSTRGTGIVRNGVVQPGYRLIAVDLVADPSAPSAFVEGIIESKMEWLIEENIITPKTADEIIDMKDNFKKYDAKNVQEAAMKIWIKIIKEIRENISQKPLKGEG